MIPCRCPSVVVNGGVETEHIRGVCGNVPDPMATTNKHGGPRPNSGGKRAGAGRPTIATEPRKTPVGPVYLTATEAATLKRRAPIRNQSVQEAVRESLRLNGLID